ncbi:MAG: hypothetical protein LUD19_03090 [Clostridia bacterium]|nr:hypothetical protein [Clostridia bacterium]
MSDKCVRRIKYGLLAISLSAFAAALVIFPERYTAVCLNGLKMWAVCVLPCLFPFMVICALFTNTGIAVKAALPLKKVTGIFKLPYAAAPCFLMSAMSGYPAGSRTVGEFYNANAVTQSGAKKLACLCSTTGPLFAMGTVGAAMFGSSLSGLKLFTAHIIAVVTVGAVYSLFTPKETSSAVKPSFKKDALRESFYGAVSASLTAGAFIVFFYTASAFVSDTDILYPLEKLLSLFAGEDVAAAVCSGVIEMTGGCAALANTNSVFALPFAGFLVTFGGACVLLQQLCYLTPAGIKPLTFILLKFLQGVLCFCLLLVMG